MGEVIKSQTLTQRRVYRIHASGSTIRCFSIVRDETRRALNYYRREDKRLHLLRANADILDETGFKRLVKHSQRARKSARMPWDPPDIETEIQFERDLFNRLRKHVFKLHPPAGPRSVLRVATLPLDLFGDSRYPVSIFMPFARPSCALSGAYKLEVLSQVQRDFSSPIRYSQ
jgi:hypothetical protein